MNSDFTDEQKQLKEEVHRLLDERATADVLRNLITDNAPYDPELWRTMGELGLMGAVIPEEYGGVGLGETALCVIAEELGRTVAPVPFFSSICMAAEAIRLAGTDEQKARWLPRLATGEVIGTFAWWEGNRFPDPAEFATSFANGQVRGAKWPVPDAEIAHLAVVVCEGARLALVDLSSQQVRREPLGGLDQLRKHARLVFEGSPAELLAGSGVQDMLPRLLDRMAIYESFEQVGAAESAMLMARDYTMQRYIFGRQLASYQAVKHNLANILAMVELARSNALYAAEALEGHAPGVSLAAATARVGATRAYEVAARENLQLHGGIGFTWEANCHFHYRRARLLALNLGSSEVWEGQLIRALEQAN